MDFLRIRQKANERARAREQAAREASPVPPEATPEGSALEAAATSDAASPARPESGPPFDPASLRSGPTEDRPAVPSGRGPEGPAVEGPSAAVTRDLARLEDALRAELTGAIELSPGAPPDEELDPLDDFFWREDETAPRLPDLVAASELPYTEPPPVRREWLTFRLGAEEYGLEIQHVREVLKPPVLTEVPRAPAHILGVIMVRGEVVAVIDPRARLGLPPQEPGPRARVLVCDAGEASCGVLVDSVSHVIRLTSAAIEQRPPGVGGISAEYIVGIGRERNRLVILLDAPALLGEAAWLRAAGTAS